MQGAGPLVQASLNAAASSQVAIRVYAVEKNPNAAVTLRSRVAHEPAWASVEVIESDMRELEAPEMADILVSELLGSWGDNELSPECLDGAQLYLKPGGVSIPCEYTSYVAPLSSSKLWNEVAKLGGRREHFETTYVVRAHTAWAMCDAQPCFTFTHPSAAAGRGRGRPPRSSGAAPAGGVRGGRASDLDASAAASAPDNCRWRTLRFQVPLGGALHGFIGFFHSVLYRDVEISIEPRTLSKHMFSWFPLYIPLRQPVLVQDDGEVRATFWRQASKQRVWYEWALESPALSPVHNPNGRSAYIGL